MNIFYLDKDPVLAAQYQCDKHVNKMTTETAQMLSTNVRLTNGNSFVFPELRHLTKNNRTEIYKVSYQNHPSTIWARTSKANFLWLKDHGLALAAEYTHRYGKMHAAFPIIVSCMENTIPDGDFTPPPLCMPDEYKTSDAIESYRKLYIHEKSKFAKWNKNRNMPEWYVDNMLTLLKGSK